jgi:hypothetical protein
MTPCAGDPAKQSQFGRGFKSKVSGERSEASNRPTSYLPGNALRRRYERRARYAKQSQFVDRRACTIGGERGRLPYCAKQSQSAADRPCETNPTWEAGVRNKANFGGLERWAQPTL